MCVLHNTVNILQVEVIGGKDKYMAVCRTCYKMPDKVKLTPTTITASPNKTTPIRGTELPHGLGRLLQYDDHDNMH